MRSHFLSISIFTVLVLTTAGFAVSKVGTTSAQFLKIGVGARAVAMGDAFVAVANDASTLYWNPAGIARLGNLEAVLVHNEWLADMYFDYAGVTYSLGNLGTLGASISTLNMGEMLVRTLQNPEGTGEKFQVGDVAAAISYARSLTDRFSIGFTAKYIRQKIWLMYSHSVALDIGVLFDTQLEGLRIGMSISNFGNNMRMEGDNTLRFYDEDPILYGNNDKVPAYLKTDYWPLPLLFRVGLAMDVVKTPMSNLVIAVDAIHPNDNPERVNLGIEYVWQNMVAFRAGYKSLFAPDTEEGLAVGGGFRFRLAGIMKLTLDYAFSDYGRLENTQKFSLGLEF